MMTRFQKISNRNIIGLLLFFCSGQFFIIILIGEGTALNYNSAIHYVSSLGVGSTALLFNFSVFILGLGTLACTYFFQKEYGEIIPSIFLFLTGVCATGVGIFPENTRPFHGIFTGFVFLFGAIFLITTIKIEQSPIIISLSILGIVIFLLAIVFLPYLGLDIDSQEKFLGFMKGTLERFIIYLTLLSYIFLGGYLGKQA
ncbi:MAG: DUF998 domain-containing protein [Candidatus Hodarchaeales archaeon]|jgi:hypothetical membrane protein